MEILYQDPQILVCVKPPRILSTDEPGGLPDLIREALGDPKANIRTVHRLDRVVSGLIVLARTSRAASDLSQQIRDWEFQKEYVAVVHVFYRDLSLFKILAYLLYLIRCHIGDDLELC